MDRSLLNASTSGTKSEALQTLRRLGGMPLKPKSVAGSGTLGRCQPSIQTTPAGRWLSLCSIVAEPKPPTFDDVAQGCPFQPRMPWPEVHEPPLARAFLQHRRLSEMADLQ